MLERRDECLLCRFPTVSRNLLKIPIDLKPRPYYPMKPSKEAEEDYRSVDRENVFVVAGNSTGVPESALRG